MAQIARAISTSPQPSLPSRSVPSAGHSVASDNVNQLDEVTTFGAAVTEDHFRFDDYEDPRRRRARREIKNTAGKVDANSSFVAHIIIQKQQDSEKAKTPQYGTEAFRNMLGRAIKAYESTAFAISGAASPLGASFSYSL